jgi:hypothetical protein
VHPTGRHQTKIKPAISVTLSALGEQNSFIERLPSAASSAQLCAGLRVVGEMDRGNLIGKGGTADAGHADPEAQIRKMCGAMVEQRPRDGCDKNESAPQQFVHLVGCRDTDASRAPWVRPRPASPKS